MIDTADIPALDFAEASTMRLISTAYIEEPSLTPLADDEDELAFLEELQGFSSSRRGLPEFIPPGVHPDELVTERHGYGSTYINAAFCYTRETGNRFNGSDRGAWYATWGEDRVETAHAEISWHLTRELEAVGVFENITAYRELHASFATPFHDVSGYTDEAFLNPDPAIGYPAGKILAAELIAREANGLLFTSVRKPGGKCLAAFRPHIIQNIRQRDTWVFEWAGHPDPSIELKAEE